MINAYVYSSCTSCKKTQVALSESGVQFNSRDFFKDRFTRDELASILSEAGLTVGDVLSKRSKVYLACQVEIDGLADDAILDLMIEEPTLLRRPLVKGDGGVVIGHNRRQLDSLIASNRN